jgi:hypothetical protein
MVRVSLRKKATVEVYSGGASMPIQFDSATSCGVVMFWWKMSHRRVVVTLGTLATAFLSAPTVRAQNRADSVGTIEGVVYDSVISRAPLRSATVFIVGATQTATTDSKGRFTISGVDAGDHIVTFSHPLFDSAGVQAPLRQVHVPAGDKVRISIATPSGATLIKAACPPGQADETGLLLGVVRDVDTGAPLPNARAEASWFELTIDAKGRHYQTFQTTATADQSGLYRLCGVPTDIPVLVRAVSGMQQSGRAEVYFDSSVVAFRDFAVSLSDTAARVVHDSVAHQFEDSSAAVPPRGTATLRGQVQDQTGRPLGDAQLSVLDRAGRVVTSPDGQFAMTGLPPGTQSIEIRAIGFAPVRRSVVLRAGAPTEVTFRLDRAAQQLAAVKVYGSSVSRYLNRAGSRIVAAAGSGASSRRMRFGSVAVSTWVTPFARCRGYSLSTPPRGGCTGCARPPLGAVAARRTISMACSGFR